LSSKSSFSNATSSSYALALHELAKEESDIEKVQLEMISLKKLIHESSNFKEVILNPMIEKNNKKNIVIKIAELSNFSDISKKFLGFVASKNRLFFLEKIIESFLNLVSKSKGELKAKLISSKKLSTIEQKKIQNELSINFKSSLNIKYEHEPDLIGGLIIQINSVMIDTSIKTKLKKLEKNMLEA
jgi:F-type H+-transporting ATPase subunit delta